MRIPIGGGRLEGAREGSEETMSQRYTRSRSWFTPHSETANASAAGAGDDTAWPTRRTKNRGGSDVGRREGDEEVGVNERVEMSAEELVHKRGPSGERSA
jgi:hypothetical protein